jgi:hypothetical protein
VFVEAIDGFIDQGAITFQVPCNLSGCQAINQMKQDWGPGDFNGTIGFAPAALNAMPQGSIKIRCNYIHEREVLLQELSSFATTQRTRKPSLFNTALPDPTALLEPYTIDDLIPID